MTLALHPILPHESPPPTPSPTWPEQLEDALASALLDLSTIGTQIYNGERGLWLTLRREAAERRVNVLAAQLAGCRNG